MLNGVHPGFRPPTTLFDMTTGIIQSATAHTKAPCDHPIRHPDVINAAWLTRLGFFMMSWSRANNPEISIATKGICALNQSVDFAH
jgi:hypothetical protein